MLLCVVQRQQNAVPPRGHRQVPQRGRLDGPGTVSVPVKETACAVVRRAKNLRVFGIKIKHHIGHAGKINLLRVVHDDFHIGIAFHGGYFIAAGAFTEIGGINFIDRKIFHAVLAVKALVKDIERLEPRVIDKTHLIQAYGLVGIGAHHKKLNLGQILGIKISVLGKIQRDFELVPAGKQLGLFQVGGGSHPAAILVPAVKKDQATVGRTLKKIWIFSVKIQNQILGLTDIPRLLRAGKNKNIRLFRRRGGQKQAAGALGKIGGIDRRGVIGYYRIQPIVVMEQKAEGTFGLLARGRQNNHAAQEEKGYQ